MTALPVQSLPLHVFSCQFCPFFIITGSISISVAIVYVIVSSCQFSKWTFSIKFSIKIVYVFLCLPPLATSPVRKPFSHYSNSSMWCVNKHNLTNHITIYHKPHIQQWKGYLLQIPVSVCLLIVFMKHVILWEDSKSRVSQEISIILWFIAVFTTARHLSPLHSTSLTRLIIISYRKQMFLCSLFHIVQ